ncbi:MAG TPA: hypothetical protein VGB27_02035 [Candidatus Binatia bacterium]|jgi:hypothetical protein
MKKLPKLERYNQMVWAVVGTGVVAVASLAILAGIAMLLYTLLKPDRSAVPVEIIKGEEPDGTRRVAARYDFCQPVSVHNSPYQLIHVVSDRFVVRKVPIVMQREKSAMYSSDGYVHVSCGIYGSHKTAAIINVLVRHADSGAMHLMLKENAVIHALEYPLPPINRTFSDHAPFPPPGVLYWVISFEDSNGDKAIDEHDDQGAYLSDTDGRNLKRITPTPSRVLEKSYDNKRKRLIMRIVRDTNNDKTLNEDDTPSLIEVNVVTRKMEREILDAKTLTEYMRHAEPKRQQPQTP